MDDREALDRFVAADAFARHLGVEVGSYGDGRATARLALRPEHLNSAGSAHGGVIFALADAAFAAASNSHGTLALAIEASISYFAAVREGVLVAEAREVACNPKLATYVIDVRDGSGARVAQMRGTVYRKRQRLAEVLA